MSTNVSDQIGYTEQIDAEASDAAVSSLQEAAASGSQKAFVDAVRHTDWDIQPPGAIKKAIDLALATGCHAIAAQLASEGHERFPEHPTLARIARALAPPKFIRTRPPVPGISASMMWLQEHTEEYRGKWVAIRNGKLLTATDSREELSHALDNLDSVSDVLVTKIS